MYKETADRIEAAEARLAKVGKLVDLPKLKRQIQDLEEEAGRPAFWNDSAAAKKKAKELNAHKKLLAEWDKAQKGLEDLKTHLELAKEADDPAELKEVDAGLGPIEASLRGLDVRLKLSGEF